MDPKLVLTFSELGSGMTRYSSFPHDDAYLFATLSLYKAPHLPVHSTNVALGLHE